MDGILGRLDVEGVEILFIIVIAYFWYILYEGNTHINVR